MVKWTEIAEENVKGRRPDSEEATQLLATASVLDKLEESSDKVTDEIRENICVGVLGDETGRGLFGLWHERNRKDDDR